MTITELIAQGEEIKRLAIALQQAEAETAAVKQWAESGHQAQEAALTRLQTARSHLAELIALRDQILAAEAEAAALSAKSRQVQTILDRLKEIVITTVTESEQNLRRQYDTLNDQHKRELGNLFSRLDPEVPLLLLPVRLETRFVGAELWLRIYPDDIHQDTLEPELTDDEVEWGTHFWQQWANSKTQNDDQVRSYQLQVWGQLAGRFKPARAAWIAKRMKPDNGIFPTPSRRTGTWTRAPHTSVLPDRWVALGYVGEQQVLEQWSELIPDPLPTFLSPTAAGGGSADLVDEGMRWMVDFEEAVQKGMGLRLTLPEAQAKTGLDRLIVVGVKATLPPDESADRLYRLLQAHHYASVCALVPQGTPTNNTPEVKSGYTARDPGYEVSFSVELEQDVQSLRNQQVELDADIAAGFLGIDRSVFENVPFAGQHDQQDARHMQSVLWPATWGYFLTQMLADSQKRVGVFSDTDLKLYRDFFITYVRGSGPLPALRVDRQPYGLLPVTSLDLWGGPNLPIPGLKLGWIDLLRALRENWRAVLDVTRVKPATQKVDPAKNLVELLGLEAMSSSYISRSVLGSDYTQNLWNSLFNQPVDSNWWQEHNRLPHEMLKGYGLVEWNPFLIQTSFATEDLALPHPLVQPEPLSETETLKDNYISWLATATPQEIHDQDYPGGTAPKALLYRLLRHATLLAYVEAAQQFDPPRHPQEPELLPLEPELIDLEVQTDPRRTPTAWRFLAGANPYRVDRGQTLHQQPTPELADFRKSLEYLSNLPTATLERLLSETLDLSSYRLDAWITACATARLVELRKTRPNGIHFGAYGWVENLRPRGKEVASTGFVHAPSLDHATAAAVLRSGYLSHRSQANGNLLAIDLSSRRVRQAQWLMDGVRSGQSLGALLGYQLERRLHERKLDKYIAPLRNTYPLVADKLIKRQNNEPVESIAANNVVDGLALLRAWQKGQAKIPASDSDLKAIEAELEALADATDAISDAAVAESVYQVVKNNQLRAGASQDAVSRGEPPPQQLEVLQTPPSDVRITHRILVLFNGLVKANDEFTQKWSDQPRARAEPYLNAWSARLFGDPANIRCQVKYEYQDPQPPHLPQSRRRWLSLKELSLCPLDLLYSAPVSEPAQRSDLEQWLIFHAMKTRNTWAGSPGNIPPDATLHLRFERNPQDWGTDVLSLPEVLELARALRELINARAIDTQDLSQPETPTESGVDLDDLKDRADQAIADLNKARDALSQLADIDADLNAVHEVLAQFAHFGFNGAIPESLVGDTAESRAVLAAQKHQLMVEIEQRLTEANNIEGNTTQDHLSRFDKVFGEKFRVLPQFNLHQGAGVDQAFAQRRTAGDATPEQVIPWFQRIAYIREGAAQLNTVLMYAEAIGANDALNFEVAQLPLPDQGTDRWVGLEAETTLGGRLSLVAHTLPGFDITQPFVGLLIDEWIEVVPHRKQTTGLTFHFDTPGAEAPQAILLAVPPVPGQPWDLKTLETIILETLELVKLRVVDPDTLAEAGNLGHFLPALYFAYNKGGDPNGDTIATDFKA